MSVVSMVIAVVIWVLALFWLSIGAAAALGRLPRNRRFGVRTDETMRSDAAFSVANKVAAPGLLAASGILVLAGLLTIGVDSGWSVLFGVVGLAAAIFLVGLVSAAGVRAAAAVPADDDGGCGCCSGDQSTHDAPGTASSAVAGTADATNDPSSAHAADCGTSSCGACTLRGVCSNETAQA